VKRVRVAPGKFVVISDELAQKAAKLRMLTKADVTALPTEPKTEVRLMAGSKCLRRRSK